MDAKPNVLFLCTGNSCRSQIAEGYLRNLAGERFQVLSAGTNPNEQVHPLAVAVMAEAGIDITNQQPKHVKTFLGRVTVRYLIIVCDGANDECPRTFSGVLHRLFWPFDDPARFTGTSEQVLAGFRRVRDEIRDKIQAWLRENP